MLLSCLQEEMKCHRCIKGMYVCVTREQRSTAQQTAVEVTGWLVDYWPLFQSFNIMIPCLLTLCSPPPLLSCWFGACQGNANSGRMGFVHFVMRMLLLERSWGHQKFKKAHPLGNINVLTKFHGNLPNRDSKSGVLVWGWRYRKGDIKTDRVPSLEAWVRSANNLAFDPLHVQICCVQIKCLAWGWH